MFAHPPRSEAGHRLDRREGLGPRSSQRLCLGVGEDDVRRNALGLRARPPPSAEAIVGRLRQGVEGWRLIRRRRGRVRSSRFRRVGATRSRAALLKRSSQDQETPGRTTLPDVKRRLDPHELASGKMALERTIVEEPRPRIQLEREEVRFARHGRHREAVGGYPPRLPPMDVQADRTMRHTLVLGRAIPRGYARGPLASPETSVDKPRA